MAQTIDFPCPTCGQMLSVDSQYAGCKGQCPYCEEHLIIPGLKQNPIKGKPHGAQESGGEERDSVYEMTTLGEYRNFAWRRWTARYIDSCVGAVLAAVVFFGLSCLYCWTGIELVFLPIQVWAVVISFFSDAWVYSMFRTTLGKKICGISVCDASGNRISASGYLARDFRVFIFGEALLIPMLSLIAHFVQYERIVRNKHMASYDEGREYQARSICERSRYGAALLLFALLGVTLLSAIVIFIFMELSVLMIFDDWRMMIGG